MLVGWTIELIEVIVGLVWADHLLSVEMSYRSLTQIGN